VLLKVEVTEEVSEPCGRRLTTKNLLTNLTEELVMDVRELVLEEVPR